MKNCFILKHTFFFYVVLCLVVFLTFFAALFVLEKYELQIRTVKGVSRNFGSR